jgi:non-specific serine/threonine protein kinase
LKPANIFVNSRGQAKILDFGLAKIGTARPAPEDSGMVTMNRADDLTKAGSTMGTVSYMSPEQARGQLTDARTDIFSLGAVIYQMATGDRPFPGETSAIIFEAILNRDPVAATQVNPRLPADLNRIIGRALEKDRSLRYQTANDMKADMLRLKRDLDSGSGRAPAASEASRETAKAAVKSVAVLYLENLSGVKEDEYLRDGVTEDIITELSKIKGLKIFSRPTVLAYRNKQVTPAQIGQQLGAAYVLGGSLRRAGTRLRINAQLVDTHTDFPVWSERYDREMQDVFELQDEIARKIAEALRITLTRQDEEALAAKPTESLQAYDLYLRGKSYARRLTRQDLEFGLQMFENAVSVDPRFALAHAAIANACAQFHYHYEREKKWIDRAVAASQRASALSKNTPEVLVAEGWILYAEAKYDQASRCVGQAIDRKADCEGAYYLLGRTLFAAGRYQEVVDMAEDAIAASGSDYNVYIPIMNALGALGKEEAKRNVRLRLTQALENHLREVPEDARARILLGGMYAQDHRVEDAIRETNLAIALRPNEATVLYNAACTLCNLNRKTDAMDALKKAWEAGFKDPSWTRRDPDLELLHGDPEFERLYPPPAE